jgi:hypothetical protein
MNRFISEKLAINVLILILSLVIVFHSLIITGIIPFDIVWGGRLSGVAQMRLYESISLVLNLLMLLMVMAKGGLLHTGISKKVYTYFFGLMSLLFFLNTIGNFISKNDLERMIFTPLTLILSILFLRLSILK